MSRIALCTLLLSCLLMAQPKKAPLTYVPGEIIIKYERAGQSPRGFEILREHNDIFGKLNTALPDIKIKVHSPVFKSVINEMINQNITEDELNVKNNLNSRLKSDLVQYREPEFSTILLLKTERPDEDIEKIAEHINNNLNLYSSKTGFKIVYAEPNYLYTFNAGEPDPLYSQQWAHTVTQIEDAWTITQGNPQIKIAIIDSGVDPDHPDLKSNIADGGYDFVDIDTMYYKEANYTTLPGEDYTNPDTDFSDFNGHGTHCAGTAAAIGNNGIGVKGVAPGCKILPVRAGFSLKSGTNEHSILEISAIVNAIRYAADNGVNIINMSFGGEHSETIQEVVKYAYYRNIVLIAAAGNSNSLIKSYPAAYDYVLAVTSIDSNKMRSFFSNFGQWVDVSAPGQDIISTVPVAGGVYSDPSGYKILSGTSMSAPYVAGVAALLLSEKPGLSNDLVYQILRASTDSSIYNDFYFGEGIINVFKTLSGEEPCIAKIFLPVIFDNILIKDQVDISGKASGKDFDKYILEYGNYVGINNTWQIAGEYHTPIDSGYLGKVIIPQDGIYYIRLRVISSDNKEYTDIIGPVTIDKKLKTGWPVTTGYSSAISPAISDIDKDGIPETIFTTSQGAVYVVDTSGNNKSGWPVLLSDSPTLVQGVVGYTSPAVDDIDNDGFEEIAVRDGQMLYVFDYEGKQKSGWPIEMGPGGFGESNISAPVIADINNDGKKEVIVNFQGGTFSDGKIFAVNSEGKDLQGWPKILQSVCIFYSTPVVCDLDGDDKIEIIIQGFNDLSKEGYVYLLDGSGNIFPGWPVEIATGSVNSPITADIDNDGKNEIIACSHIDNEESGDINIYVINKNGTLLNGFPVSLDYRMFTYHNVTAGISAGDINNDGYKEILVGSRGYDYSLCAIDRTGNIIWKFNSVIFEYVDSSSPLIADLNGDTNPEIIISKVNNINTYGKILVVDNMGNEVSELSRYVTEQIRATPSIGDIDGDNKLELVCTSVKGSIYCWDYDAPYNQANLIWPTYQQNFSRTGSFEDKIVSVSEKNKFPTIYSISQNYPNPFNPITEIQFSVPVESNVKITVFNLLGETIKELLNSTRRPGFYNIIFNAENLASGLYFYMFESSAVDGSKQFREIKKMMLIK